MRARRTGISRTGNHQRAPAAAATARKTAPPIASVRPYSAAVKTPGQLSAGRLHGYGFLHEACVQLWGEGGERQVTGPPRVAVAAARLVRRTLYDVGLIGAVKTSGATGVHVFVPIRPLPMEDAAAATRAIAARAAALDPDVATTEFVKDERGGRVFVDPTRVGGGTVIAAYSPRVRPGVSVSFPVPWDDLDDVRPKDFTVHNVVDLLGDRDPWAEQMPEPQALSEALVEERTAIPVGRVADMHEGKRRALARRQAGG